MKDEGQSKKTNIQGGKYNKHELEIDEGKKALEWKVKKGRRKRVKK